MSTIINNLNPLTLDEVTIYAKPQQPPPEPPGGTIGGWDPKHPAPVLMIEEVQSDGEIVPGEETPTPD